MRLYMQKAAAIGFLVFLGLSIFGTFRGIALDYPLPDPMFISSMREQQMNAQGANNLKQIGLVQTPLPLVLDRPEVEQIRIHEKRAVLGIGTPNFQSDEALLREAVKEHKAEIFTEYNV